MISLLQSYPAERLGKWKSWWLATILSNMYQYHIPASVVQWLGCLPWVGYNVGSNHNRVKIKAIRLVFSFFAFPLNTQYKIERTKTEWLGIRIICPRIVVSVRLYYENPTKCNGLVQIGHRDGRIECNLFSQWYSLTIVHLT